MRILYIHQYFSTPKGSVGTRSYEFGKRLVAAGHEVTVLCGSSHLTDVPNEVDGIRIVQIPINCSNRDGFLKRAFSFILFSLRATWRALRLDYDLVYATSTPLTVGIPALVAKWLRGKQFIFEVRDLWPELPRAMGIIKNPLILWLMEWFEGFCYQSADVCIGLSPGIVAGIQKKKSSGEVVLIPNACDLEVFGKRKGESGNWKAESGNGEVESGNGKWESGNGEVDGARQRGDGAPKAGAPRAAEEQSVTLSAVFCGAHGRANGLDAVLDAAVVLKNRGRSDIRILFVGDGQLKPQLKERAQREGLQACRFIDPIPKSELAGLLAKADLGLMILADVPAFRYGTSPNKFFDYIASGLPVLCNYPGWVSDLIAEWDCGVSVAPGDAEAFAEALIAYADQPERMKKQGARAREMAEAEFDRDELFERLNQVIVGMDTNV